MNIVYVQQIKKLRLRIHRSDTFDILINTTFYETDFTLDVELWHVDEEQSINTESFRVIIDDFPRNYVRFSMGPTFYIWQWAGDIPIQCKSFAGIYCSRDTQISTVVGI